MSTKIAIVLGATGLTGNLLLTRLLKDNRYSIIKVFTRRLLDIEHPKLRQFKTDLFYLESVIEDFTGDEVHCCIGTTLRQTPDKEIYRKIDHGIPVMAAKLCVANGINTLSVVSAVGANSESSIFYTRLKGEMERDILALNILQTYFLQPAIIVGDRSKKRLGEIVGIFLVKLITPLLVGSMKKYRLTPARDIANAMIRLANHPVEKVRFTSPEIIKLSSLE